MQPVVVLKIIMPATAAIASRWVVVIRGGINALVVELRSNTLDALGVVVPIPTCAAIVTTSAQKKNEVKISFLIMSIFVLNAFDKYT